MLTRDEINRNLRNLKRRGFSIPSSKAAYRITLGDVFTPAGYVSKRVTPERLKQVQEAFPELFSKHLIEQDSRERIERVINNYNKTVTQSDRINVRVADLSPHQINKLRTSISRRQHISNIYLPEFGMTLKEAIREALNN